MQPRTQTGGYTLIELLVAVSIAVLLSSIVTVSISAIRKSSRDTQRIQHMQEIQTALKLYHQDFGKYPDEESTPGKSGWEYSNEENSTFISELVGSGYLETEIVDPTNDDQHSYRYYRYPANYRGCEKPFYILGITNMETSEGVADTSPGWSCPDRDWQTEVEWVTGEFQ